MSEVRAVWEVRAGWWALRRGVGAQCVVVAVLQAVCLHRFVMGRVRDARHSEHSECHELRASDCHRCAVAMAAAMWRAARLHGVRGDRKFATKRSARAQARLQLDAVQQCTLSAEV